MDLYFSRFSHPHLSVEKGVEFEGNVVDLQGNPYHLSIKVTGEQDKDTEQFCELTLHERDHSFLTIYTPHISMSRYSIKQNPDRTYQYHNLSKLKLIGYHRLGMFELVITLTYISINFISPTNL